MKTYYDILFSLGACSEALNARKEMTVEDAMLKAERGDWILWLASRLKLDHRKITLAKAKCAQTVIPFKRYKDCRKLWQWQCNY